MKKYIMCLMLVLFIRPVFGSTYAARLERVTDAHMRESVLRANLTVGDLKGGGLISSGTPYYVDSVNGANNRSGKTWDLAVASIDTAINLVAAAITAGTEKGDPIIYVREGHNEGGSTSAIFDADVDGLTIYGLGKDNQKPTLDFDGATATCAVGADGVTIYNIRFRASTTTVKGEIAANEVHQAITVDAGADGCHFINCDFGFAEAVGDEFLFAVTVGVATGTVFDGCFFDSGENQAVAAIQFDGVRLLTIRNTKIYGDYIKGLIYSATTTNSKLVFDDNTLWSGVHSGLNTTAAWLLNSADVGISRRNYIATNMSTVGAAVSGNGMLNFGNYYNEDAGGTKTAFAFDTASTTAGTGRTITVSGDD
ncbi:hypothetical protein LCGC14_1589560 [marine sediment metagenome]|uniref:Right handed beta helix domain-containing protein n=1 Tax=marine sediment metagenome TaxID=412755 RepID=A0A0F9LEV5_9ZZZZ